MRCKKVQPLVVDTLLPSGIVYNYQAFIMTDELISKYNSMNQDFKSQSEKLLKEILHGFNQTVDVSKNSYVSLQEGYLKGYIDITNQAKKANTEMLKNLNHNFGDLKSSVNNLYNQLMKNTADAYNTSISQFTKQCEEIRNKFSALSDAPYKEALKVLNGHYKKMLEVFAKRYKELIADLDNKHANLAKELTMPDIPSPIIIPPSFTTVSTDENATNSSKASKKK